MTVDRKQAMHVDACKSFSTAEANENERRSNEDKIDRKNQDPTNHYDRTRMKLNFEITSQMKDMSAMTSEFLKGMGSLSKDMMKLTKEKDFLKVQKQFSEAMTGIELQTERMEEFMDETESAFSAGVSDGENNNAELEKLIGNEAVTDNLTEQEIEKELNELKKRMG